MSEEKNSTQMALEYLVTYGWALVLIATLITVLVFVGPSNVNVNSCSNFVTMVCKGVGAEGDILILILQNSTGQKITINPFTDIRFDKEEGYAIITYMGNDYRFEDVTIGPGDQFTILAKGKALAKEISITYVERSTGLRKTVTSTISTDAPDDIELSNDGIDNDGDGLTDCEDPDVEDCEYLSEPESVSNTVIEPGERVTVVHGPLRAPDGSIMDGCWEATAASLSFYAESFDPETIVVVRAINPGSAINTPIYVEGGWNTADLVVSPGQPAQFWGADVHDFNIYAKSAIKTFTINNTDKSPKPVWVVNAADPADCP